jgi:hypothetical protein
LNANALGVPRGSRADTDSDFGVIRRGGLDQRDRCGQIWNVLSSSQPKCAFRRLDSRTQPTVGAVAQPPPTRTPRRRHISDAPATKARRPRDAKTASSATGFVAGSYLDLPGAARSRAGSSPG